HRASALECLDAGEMFDVLVIGGGIIGAGCALDAASRGLNVALVERHDFASGTSSKSSKLVHGGLRYLQQREIGLVYEALAERQVLRTTAPHLVRILPFLLPVFKGRDNLFDRRIARIVGTSMWLYDFTGGARIGKLHKKLTTEQAREHMPSLRADRVAYSYLYYDARTDDARLTLMIARTAADLGATILNYASVVEIRKEHGRCTGATVAVDGRTIEVRARAVVNATGVWADDVRALDEGTHPSSIRPAKGVHITVPWAKVRNDIAAVVPVPKDRRSVFVVPWGDSGSGEPEFTYIGTTDTDYDGDTDDPQCTPGDVEYLIRAINFSTDANITDADVLGTWAGLRPLVKAAGDGRTTDLSRKHSVRRSDSGLVTVTGGKLTTYRLMAADTVDMVEEPLGRKTRSRTKHVRLAGADGWDSAGLSEHLQGRYGALGRDVETIASSDPALRAPLVAGAPYSRAEAVYAVREEMATSVDDVLSRRTRARLLARDASAAAAADVAALIGAELGWNDTERDAQAAAYRSAIEHERASISPPEQVLDASTGA
ncbi:MAG TPA: glycerol-3-phosphate dehydrogenase/oxidase, partial [Acidimicrobiia bacterium]